VPAPRKIPQSEEEWFTQFLETAVPVKSGTQKERRLAQSSARAFYEQEYLPAAKAKKMPLRTLQTVINWLDDHSVKPCKFDRYRCEKCFSGRQAEAHLRNGVGQPGDEKVAKDYRDHLKVVENQREQVKKQKAENGPDVLTAVFDYSTVHEFTNEKVKWRGFCCIKIEK